MSLSYSNTGAGVNGIIQQIEDELGFDAGVISNNSTLLKTFTSAVNSALDDFISIAIQASGKWQFDDSNQTDYPVIYTNLVSGQRDYTVLSDANSNLVLDIYKVAIFPTATATLYQSIDPINELGSDTDIVTERTTGGVPYGYGKLANGIFLEPRPNYNATSGLKVYINREGSYFLTSDTNKKPGIPGLFHKYLYLKPAREWARRKSMAIHDRLAAEVLKLEGDERAGVEGEIANYFAKREKDDRSVLSNEPIIFQ